MSETITIDVSGAGAIASGTSRRSTGSKVLSETDWRWSRGLDAWCLPRRLRNETVDLKVSVTVERLTAAGVEVNVVGQDARETDEERAARLLDRDRELIEVHERKAAQARALGDDQWEKGGEIAGMIPLGQPVLAGHHSEARHRRDLGRIRGHSGRAGEAWKEAKDRESLAASARQRVAAAETPPTEPRFGREDISVGDAVMRRGTWYPVVRVNAKTVTVASIVGRSWSNRWTNRLPYDEITDVRRRDGQPSDAGRRVDGDPAGPNPTD